MLLLAQQALNIRFTARQGNKPEGNMPQGIAYVLNWAFDGDEDAIQEIAVQSRFKR
jgi:hypothetical protein